MASDSSDWETASEEGVAEQQQEQNGQQNGQAEDQGGAGAAQDPANEDPAARGAMQHGCAHYRRRCRLVSPCCDTVYWCRHCHNHEKSDNESDPKKRHTLERTRITEVICALCDTRQPAATHCNTCQVAFGAFTCMHCKFFDDDTSKQQFHCDKCGICRVGGRDNYFHCDTCNCCYSVQLRDTHVCVQNSMACNCPVCFEYLFDSVKPINVMPCGHTIHQECLRGLADHQCFVCPVCQKSYMTASQKARLWQSFDDAVAQTRMPDEYRDMKVNILCNDCNIKGQATFHVVGHKCQHCGGYNTARV